MFKRLLNEKIPAGVFALFFILFTLGSAISMMSTAHASTMPDRVTTQDHSAHLGYSNDTDMSANTFATVVASHNASSACAALCQSSTTTKLSVTLPESEKEEDDEPFDEIMVQENCLITTDTLEPVYKEYERKVPLYLEYCLLII